MRGSGERRGRGPRREEEIRVGRGGEGLVIEGTQESEGILPCGMSKDICGIVDKVNMLQASRIFFWVVHSPEGTNSEKVKHISGGGQYREGIELFSSPPNHRATSVVFELVWAVRAAETTPTISDLEAMGSTPGVS